MDYSPPGSSVHGILQARILEWVAIPFSRGFSHLWDQTRVSVIAGGLFTAWAPREALGNILLKYKTTICDLFSLLTKILARFTPCVLELPTCHILYSIFSILEFTCIVHLQTWHLFSLTHLCFNQFIDQFRNSVTSMTAEEIHGKKVMGPRS